MKQWLTNNEIYFKTLAYIIVSVVLIVIAIKANGIASNQAQIMQEQTKLLRQQQLPVIWAVVDQIFDKEQEKCLTDVMRVFNQGGELFNLHIYPAIFFKVEYGKRGSNLTNALIPINEYYTATIITHEQTGEIATLIGLQNNAKAIEAQWNFASYADSLDSSGIVDTVRYLEVAYSDKFSAQHLDVYRVDSINGSVLLETPGIVKLAATQAIKFHREGTLKNVAVTLSEITPPLLLSKLEIAQQTRQEYSLLKFLDYKPPPSE